MQIVLHAQYAVASEFVVSESPQGVLPHESHGELR